MALNYFVIIAYLFSLPLIGYFTRRKIKTADDYFLGARKIPWWAVAFSIVAAETSTLTFISVPGLSYLTNLTFLQVVFGYIIGRVIVAFFFLPSFFRGELSTSYEFLGIRFGTKLRKVASVSFLFTRIAADGVRLFATAIPLKFLLGINYFYAIILIALIALLYSTLGGMRSVIWVDVWQMFIYIGGALFAGFYLVHLMSPEGWDKIFSLASINGKLKVVDFGFTGSIADFFTKPYTLFSGLIGGAFLSMASHGTDQLIIQRLLSINKLKDAKKAVITSGVLVFMQMVLFLLIGLGLFAFYGKINIKPDEIFVKFIIGKIPAGFSGLIIAGVFAAAISTIAGSINSMASSSVYDLFYPNVNKLERKKEMLISRGFSVLWAFLLIGSAFFFSYSSSSVIELALGIASFTYGALLGVFLLGLWKKDRSESEGLIVFILTLIFMIIIVMFTKIAWTWYILFGVLFATLIGGILSLYAHYIKNYDI